MAEPSLSVVIIGRNEGPRLERCLASVQAMSYAGPTEIIYVDSASTDGSPARAAEHGARVVELKSDALTAARARNAGWQIATAPFILFLDGDTILDPDFVTKALAEFEDSKIMVVCGHRREIHPEASVYNRVCDLDWVYAVGVTDFCGGDAVIRRTALEQTGGYSPELIAGEEPDLCRRIRAHGGVVLRLDIPMTGHDLAMTSFTQYWRRSLRTGHAYAEIAALYKTSGDPFWTAAARHNVKQAVIYMVAPTACFVGALLFHSWLLALAPLVGAALLVVRTAIKYRHKPAGAGTLLLFGIHSHLQSIPVFIGQSRFWMNSLRNRRSSLIEYKKIL